MEEDLWILVKICVDKGLCMGLNAENVGAFCNKHGIDQSEFFYAFAKHVAIEFANGELSYADGDVVMNELIHFSGCDDNPFILQIYQAFDAGEFYRNDDPKGTIPWQKYTLPLIMKALAKEGLKQ